MSLSPLCSYIPITYIYIYETIFLCMSILTYFSMSLWLPYVLFMSIWTYFSMSLCFQVPMTAVCKYIHMSLYIFLHLYELMVLWPYFVHAYRDVLISLYRISLCIYISAFLRNRSYMHCKNYMKIHKMNCILLPIFRQNIAIGNIISAINNENLLTIWNANFKKRFNILISRSIKNRSCRWTFIQI